MPQVTPVPHVLRPGAPGQRMFVGCSIEGVPGGMGTTLVTQPFDAERILY